MRSPRAAAAVGASLAAAALGGCSTDIAPVREAGVRNCLSGAGERPRGFRNTPAAPAPHRVLARAEGLETTMLAGGERPDGGDAWATLFFYDGAERADRTKRALQASGRLRVRTRGGRQVTLLATRRHNVIMLFGRRSVFGVPASAAQKRRLQRCFDRSSRAS